MEEKRWRNVTWTPPRSRHCSDRLKKSFWWKRETTRRKKTSTSFPEYEFCVVISLDGEPSDKTFLHELFFFGSQRYQISAEIHLFFSRRCVQSDKSRPSSYTPFFRLDAAFCLILFLTGRKARVHKLMRLRRCEKKRISRVHFSPQLYTLLSSLLKSHFFFTVLFGPRNCHLTSIPPHWKPTWARNSCSSCANVHKMSSVRTKFAIFFAYFFLIIKKRKLFTKFFLVTLAIWTWAREESERERRWYEEGENVSERHTHPTLHKM